MQDLDSRSKKRRRLYMLSLESTTSTTTSMEESPRRNKKILIESPSSSMKDPTINTSVNHHSDPHQSIFKSSFTAPASPWQHFKCTSNSVPLTSPKILIESPSSSMKDPTINTHSEWNQSISNLSLKTPASPWQQFSSLPVSSQKYLRRCKSAPIISSENRQNSVSTPTSALNPIYSNCLSCSRGTKKSTGEESPLVTLFTLSKNSSDIDIDNDVNSLHSTLKPPVSFQENFDSVSTVTLPSNLHSTYCSLNPVVTPSLRPRPSLCRSFSDVSPSSTLNSDETTTLTASGQSGQMMNGSGGTVSSEVDKASTWFQAQKLLKLHRSRAIRRKKDSSKQPEKRKRVPPLHSFMISFMLVAASVAIIYLGTLIDTGRIWTSSGGQEERRAVGTDKTWADMLRTGGSGGQEQRVDEFMRNRANLPSYFIEQTKLGRKNPNVPPLEYATLAVTCPNPFFLQNRYSEGLGSRQEPVLHGLWPPNERAPSSDEYEKSDVSRSTLSEGAREWPNLKRKLGSVTEDDHNHKFWSQEWVRHGSKSGYKLDAYMKKTLRFFRDVKPKIVAVLREIKKSYDQVLGINTAQIDHQVLRNLFKGELEGEVKIVCVEIAGKSILLEIRVNITMEDGSITDMIGDYSNCADIVYIL